MQYIGSKQKSQVQVRDFILSVLVWVGYTKVKRIYSAEEELKLLCLEFWKIIIASPSHGFLVKCNVSDLIGNDFS